MVYNFLVFPILRLFYFVVVDFNSNKWAIDVIRFPHEYNRTGFDAFHVQQGITDYVSGCLPMAFSMEGLWRSRALIFPLHFAIITFKAGNPGISGRRFLYALWVLSGKEFEMMNCREWISLPVPAIEKPDAFL